MGVMVAAVAAFALLAACSMEADTESSQVALSDGPEGVDSRPGASGGAVALGPRPYFLVNDMPEGSLKDELRACFDDQPVRTSFSIGHRGAPLQFPEHTRESYEAAWRMGAGMLECDVTFTRDRELVCRHSQNDLATTTNILMTPLANTCVVPFTPAVFDDDGSVVERARAECRVSDITLAEFKSLRGKMDAFDPAATTAEAFLAGTAPYRTDLYSGVTGGTLMTHAESIALFDELGVSMTPELKEPVVEMPFMDYTQADYARQLIEDYRTAGIDPARVYPQSFGIEDVRYWIRETPDFGRQAVYLDDAESIADLPDAATLRSYRAEGIRIVAPPIFALLESEGDRFVPSAYARAAKSAGLSMIAWTLERSGPLADGDNGFYYQTFDSAVSREGDLMRVIDTLAREVGVMGIFSDWAAPVSFYASCMGLK